MSVRDYFDRVVVINLDRRPDRWERFQSMLARTDWPFRQPERVAGIEGDAVTAPPWWKQGAGAWGCLATHARILEDAIRDEVERLLILEDDVLFVDDLPAAVERFLNAVPDDWDQLYFGGQHLRDPRRLNAYVYACMNVNRTHCHAVSRKFMPRMYRYILNAPDYIANPGHHIDHRLGALHETGTVRVYAPTEWIAGQTEDSSDISGRTNETFFWNTWAAVPEMPMYVVLGLHAGRAHEVAALMKKLGAHFGQHLSGYAAPQMEDVGLARLCERVYPFPSTTRQVAVGDSAPAFHDWCRVILQEAANYGTVGAGCYPTLCALHDDLSRAWRGIKVIDVPMSTDEAVDALIARSAEASGWLRISDEEAAAVQLFLQSKRAEWLDHCESITIDPRRFDTDTAGLVQELRDFLNLPRTSMDPTRVADVEIE